MNENELKLLWQTSNDKLEKNLVINKKNTHDLKKIKVYNILGSMKPIKIFILLVAILWVGIGTIVLSSIYVNGFSEANKFFLFSASIQICLTAVALFIYVYQLITIYQVDITDEIIRTQEKLANLKISTLWVTRVLFLQLPVWTTFWWSETMLKDWSIFQWSIALLFTSSFTFIALWLFSNIRYENRNKKWFKFIFRGKEWQPIIQSMKLLNQIQKYQEE